LKAEKYRVEGDMDPQTANLRNYMKVEGQVDIQKFKKELVQKQMATKIPKEAIKNPSPPRENIPSKLSMV
jgi:hypothetical protein